MKRLLIVPFVLLILASTGVSSTLCTSGVGLDAYITNYNGFTNACQIGDKLFYNFGFSSSVSSGTAPAASQALVIPDPGDGFSNPGIVFSVGGFFVSPGHTLDATITYSIATLSGSNIMEDYELSIAGSHTGASNGGLGTGQVTESFGNAPAGSPLVTTVAGPPPGGINTAQVSFLPWVSGTAVTTQVHLQSPSPGSDLVTISVIQEHFSEAVPEPFQTILIGSGLLFFGLWRKRVKYSSN